MKNAHWTTRSSFAAPAASAISLAAPIIPKCKYTPADHPGHQVPEMRRRRICAPRNFAAEVARGRIFYGCNRYPDCDFTTPHEPINEPCPKCHAPFIVEKRSKQGNFRTCMKEGCDWEIELPPPAEAVADPAAVSAAPPSTNGHAPVPATASSTTPKPKFVHPQEPVEVVAGSRDKS